MSLYNGMVYLCLKKSVGRVILITIDILLMHVRNKLENRTQVPRVQGCSGYGERGSDAPVNSSGDRCSTKCSQHQLNCERNFVSKRPLQFI